MKNLVVLISFSINILVIGAVFLVSTLYIFTSDYKYVYKDCQEGGDSIGYCVYILEKSNLISSVYSGVITRDVYEESFPDYGHYFTYIDQDIRINAYSIEEIKVNWNNDGVEIIDSLNRKLFFPKALYEGGR